MRGEMFVEMEMLDMNNAMVIYGERLRLVMNAVNAVRVMSYGERRCLT